LEVKEVLNVVEADIIEIKQEKKNRKLKSTTKL